jgi:hypothetical protein
MSSSNYYKKHRDEILENNRSRYQSDPVYRQECIDKVKVYKKNLSAEKKAKKALEKAEKKVWKVFSVDGVETQCCKVGFLAKSIKRSVQTIRLWERDNLFPVSIRYNGQRYYMKKHYDMIISLWLKNLPLNIFLEKVREQWNE